MTQTRNEPVIDDLLAALFQATGLARAILDNCHEDRAPLAPVHRQMFQEELTAITRALDDATCVS